ncbi:GrpB family protein [Pseudaminobacter sp. NGMCC 1.201702]|uniref:GrpB family protein n=1 Tax=Pseudaminobacter sp. NGMCC 1.201702 TaxID=3391825 RepID=UPI0039F0FAA9
MGPYACRQQSCGAEARQRAIEALAYEWWRELGLSGRRYCSKANEAGRGIIQLHCYADGSPETARHLAFRHYLRENPKNCGRIRSGEVSLPEPAP